MSEKKAKSPLKKKIEKKSSRVYKKNYVLDLRVHSPSSLGYLGVKGLQPAPALVRLAKVKGIDVIAVTDYYHASFVDELSTAAIGSSLTVIPGTIIRCQVNGCDDVSLVCLFPENYREDDVEQFLRAIKVSDIHAGSSEYVVEVTFDKILKTLERHGGFAIPSRMDKTPHRKNTIAVLVEKYGFRTFDLAYADTHEWFKATWPRHKFNLYSFSNATALAQVGSRSATVKLTAPSFGAIKEIAHRALSGK